MVWLKKFVAPKQASTHLGMLVPEVLWEWATLRLSRLHTNHPVGSKFPLLPITHAAGACRWGSGGSASCCTPQRSGAWSVIQPESTALPAVKYTWMRSHSVIPRRVRFECFMNNPIYVFSFKKLQSPGSSSQVCHGAVYLHQTEYL